MKDLKSAHTTSNKNLLQNYNKLISQMGHNKTVTDKLNTLFNNTTSMGKALK